MHSPVSGSWPCRPTLFLLVLAWSLFSTPAGAAISLPQADGGKLALDAPAQRIVTLAPNLAELVFAAGAGDRLVGVVEYSNFPPEAQRIPRIGDAFRVDLEGVLALQPDLVIAWPSGNPPGALVKLAQLGATLWRVEISTPEEIAAGLENIARATGSEARGLAAAGQLRGRLQRLRQTYAGKSPVSYFYQVSARPLYTINGAHIISQGLALCAGNNVFANLPTLAPQITREAVVAADPQAMFAPRGESGPADLAPWLDWPGLRAVRHEALFYLPADSISQATPRMLDALDSACKLLDRARQQTMEK